MKNETTKDMIAEWQKERDQNTLTQNIVALLGIHGVHCEFEKFQDASHITQAFEDLITDNLKAAREEERDKERIDIFRQVNNIYNSSSSPRADILKVLYRRLPIDCYEKTATPPNN